MNVPLFPPQGYTAQKNMELRNLQINVNKELQCSKYIGAGQILNYFQDKLGHCIRFETGHVSIGSLYRNGFHRASGFNCVQQTGFQSFVVTDLSS